MKILIAASDLTPLISNDPRLLAQAVPSLPLALQQAGHEVSVIGPLHPALEASPELKIKATGVRIAAALGHDRPTVEVREARSPQGLQMFLFQQPEIFGPAPSGQLMNARAATFFSKLIVELARRLNPAPDVLQIQDWPGALAPVFLKAQNLPFASVLAVSDPTVHGSFPIEDFGLLNLGWEYFRPTAVEFYGRVNFLKTGILSSDAVVLDGDLERAAVQTPEEGGGLDVVFRENAARLHGIPPGLDEQTWNPATDGGIARKYRPANLAGKATCRNVLLAQVGLAKNPVGPVFLLDLSTDQENIYLEMLARRLDQLLADEVRLIVLGDVPDDSPVAVTFDLAARKYPDKLTFVKEIDDRLMHMALSGADFQLFLGRQRGISVRLLRSLKYGTLPIATAGAGLRQLVEDYHPGSDHGSGLVFYHADGEALFDVLAHRAPALLDPPDRWESLRQRAMIHAGRFSWARAAAQYVSLYGQLGRR